VFVLRNCKHGKTKTSRANGPRRLDRATAKRRDRFFSGRGELDDAAHQIAPEMHLLTKCEKGLTAPVDCDTIYDMENKIDWKEITFAGATFNKLMEEGLFCAAKLQIQSFTGEKLSYKGKLIVTENIDWSTLNYAKALLNYQSDTETGYFDPELWGLEQLVKYDPKDFEPPLLDKIPKID